MTDLMPMSADFPSMGQGWPRHVINCSAHVTGTLVTKAGSGKSGAPDGGTSHRTNILSRGPKPITVRRIWAGNVAEATATARNIRIISSGGGQFRGGQSDGSS